jgi:photosystem II stability/assembly factor-like uncharacterized protein
VSVIGKRWAGALLGAGLCCAAGLASGAASFTPVVSGTAHQALFAVATHGDVAIAVGAAGAILESADAGKSWKPVLPAPTPLSLLGVTVADGHALAVGQEGTVLVMDEAGKWTKSTSGTDSRLFAVSVNGNGRAVAVGAFGTIILSDDGGKSWTSIAPDWNAYNKEGEQPHLYDAAVDQAGALTVAGEFGLILHSVDGGKTWQTQHQGDASLFALELQPDGSGYAVGQNGTVLHSANKGKSWDTVDAGTTAILLGVHAADGKVVVTGMHDMLQSADGGRTWSHIGGEEVNTSWYQGIAGAGAAQTLLVVGHSGQIVRVAD